MEPVNFLPGYYRINGVPDNRFPEWYLVPSEVANHDKFLWLSGQYATPLHQAQTHAIQATKRETKGDAILTLSIAPEAGPISYDWHVEIDNNRVGINISGRCAFTGFHAVEYLGPPEMHTHEYRRAHEATELYKKLYSEAEVLCDAGDSRFRRSNRNGIVMYTGSWPRYHSDGSWWEGAHESSHLTFNNDQELLEQWEVIFNWGTWEEKFKSHKHIVGSPN